jgi:hypothetical protein
MHHHASVIRSLPAQAKEKGLGRPRFDKFSGRAEIDASPGGAFYCRNVAVEFLCQPCGNFFDADENVFGLTVSSPPYIFPFNFSI